MSRFFISDLHFFHEYIMDYDVRPFQNASEMKEYMIVKWNNKVKPEDEVVLLGDFSLGSTTETMSVLKELHGRKCLVVGNRDKYIIHSIHSVVKTDYKRCSYGSSERKIENQ